ncbi:MAG: TatD family hydrolase [Acholeplasmatales bacterium]|nr:TatD family hydrolase [Acholeplasmatales bacterium]
MIDTHSHLFDEEFDLDRDLCIKRAIEANVKKIILVGFSKETNLKAQELAKKYNIFFPTAGLHPSEANSNYLEEFEEFKRFAKENKIYAVGECGLDYHWDITYKEEQKKLFRLQCEYAIENDLPIIVHSRDAQQDTFDIIKSYNGKLKGVMHCYSGSKELAKEYVKLGFYISLGGPLTFKNAKEPKEVCINTPLDRLLIETDCPYLAPTPFRGKRNESAYVKYVLEEMAKLKGIPISIVEDETESNAERLFKI